MQELQHGTAAGENNTKIVYFLYLASLIFGITSLIGLVMAYMNINDADQWVKTHYRYQIRTFWIGLVYSIIAFMLVFVVIGYLLLPVIAIWLIVRCIKGMKALEKKQAIENETRWGF